MIKKIPKTIRAKKDSKTSSGSYGTYFSHNNYGVKTFDVCNYMNSLEEIINEYTYMKMAETSGCTPKVYGFTFVNRGRNKYLGIVMQHIKGESLYDYSDEMDGCIPLNDIETLSDNVWNYMEKGIINSGLNLGDWHEGNIIGRKESIVEKCIDNPSAIKDCISSFTRIDFSDRYVSIRDDRNYDKNTRKYKRIFKNAVKKLKDMGIKVPKNLLKFDWLD